MPEHPTKFPQGYRAVSVNLASAAADLNRLADEFVRWKGVDLVAAYHHPDRGLLTANPKNADQLANFGPLQKRELLVIYAGKGSGPADESCVKAAKLAAALFEGAKVKVPAELLRGNFTAKTGEKPVRAAHGQKKVSKAGRGVKNVPRAAASPTIAQEPVRMTPRYSVTVTNELFHNGNVEAWKRIIASYRAKYPDLRVYIYYEGERILDINSLFGWGKVKHGSAIQFAVAGNGIRDVAKLQRYLAQGAGNQFEVFLRNAVSDILRLF
ncbi:hypothetical protein FACS189442_1410 [Spirochaetia bacterium]|nr:hypothetical protein FACS189442_1410 [Spirochaetia bacterium]